MDADIEELEQAANEVLEETLEIWEKFQSSSRELSEQFRSIEGCFTKQRRQRKKLASIRELKSELKGNSNLMKVSENAEAMKNIEIKLDSTQEMIKKLGKSKIRLGSVFLRLIIGHVSVKLWNEGERVQFKQEYNRFKESWLPAFIIFPLCELYFGWSLALNQLYTLFTFYYYVSLAIRENILKVNGSTIERWWIYHHYVSVVAGILLMLTHEEHPLIVHGAAETLNLNMLWQAIVMIVQNQYQRQRHYTRKALAKKTAMDLRTTEVIDENPHQAGLFRFLIPALWVTYAFQLVTALNITYILYAYQNEFDTWGLIQMYILIICWFLLPLGNAITLIKVLAKRNPKLRAIHKTYQQIDRRQVFKYLTLMSIVLRSMIKQAMSYAMHVTKSLSKRAVKMAGGKKKSKKSKSAASSSSSSSSSNSSTSSAAGASSSAKAGSAGSAGNDVVTTSGTGVQEESKEDK